MADEALWAQAGLLDGLEGAHREERLSLLDWLAGEGFELEELAIATRNGTVVLLAASRALGGGDQLSAREVAEQAGISLELLRELRRASALPMSEDVDLPEYGPVDLEAARSAKRFLDAGLTEQQVLATTRVLGRGMAQAAEQMRQQVFELVVVPGVTELELARAYSGAAHHLVPMLAPLTDRMLRMHLDHAVSEEVLTSDERAAGSLAGARDVAVAFADLVGFTRMGEELGPDELERVAERLTVLAAQVAAPPVRLVKSIGDAVLLTSPDAAALVRAVFALTEAAAGEGEGFPQLRVGLAHGAAVARAGDVFGPPVNLASRLTGIARAGSVVGDEHMHEHAHDAADWSYAGERKVKGVRGPVKLFRARPAS